MVVSDALSLKINIFTVIYVSTVSFLSLWLQCESEHKVSLFSAWVACYLSEYRYAPRRRYLYLFCSLYGNVCDSKSGCFCIEACSVGHSSECCVPVTCGELKRRVDLEIRAVCSVAAFVDAVISCKVCIPRQCNRSEVIANICLKTCDVLWAL